MQDEIILRAANYDDPTEDHCSPMFSNDRTVAILEINGIMIPLSLDRVNNLIDKVNEFSNTIFCYKCEHFIMSKSGWNYGGSCKFDAEKEGKIITEENAGYSYCVDCMQTCTNCSAKGSNIND